MEDPLTLLRKAVSKGQAAPSSVDGVYTIGSHQFPEKTETCFKRSIGQQEYYYTLRDIIFYLDNAEVPNQEYRKEVVKAKLTAIVEQDKADLKNYLQGKIDTCAQLDMKKAVASAQAAAASSKLSSSSSSASQASKSASSAAPQAQDSHLSAEEMEAQRQRHAESLSRTASKPSKTDETPEEKAARRKRKLLGPAADAGEIDGAFIEIDRQALKVLRSEDVPSQDYRSVLRKPGAVSSSPTDSFAQCYYLKTQRKFPCPANTTSRTFISSQFQIVQDFGFVLKSFNDHVLKPKEAKQASSSSSSAAQSKLLTNVTKVDGKLVRVKPIIIVPSALTSVITSFNVLDFLEGNYIFTDEKRNQGIRRETEQKYLRKLRSSKGEMRTIEYRILDNPLILKPEEWNAVVAVFVTGQVWQFKDWNDKKWANPSSLFSEVLGVHLMMNDSPVDPKVQEWNIKILKIHQTKRHLDAGAVNEFWMAFDSFTKLRKPYLDHT